MRYFCCPKENIHFGNICHVAESTAPLPQKVTAALPEKKHSLVPPSVFSPSFLPTFCGRVPSARFVKSKEFKFGRLLHVAMDYAAVIPPDSPGGDFFLVHFSPLFHKRDCSRRLRACKHTRLTPIRFLWYAPSARFIAGEKSKFGQGILHREISFAPPMPLQTRIFGFRRKTFFCGAFSFAVCFYLLRLVSLLPAAF